MRPRRRVRQHRNYTRSAGQEAALRHIEQARAFSHEIGGTDADVKAYFFSLGGSELGEIFLAYGKINGKEAELYARQAFQKWKSGSTQMSGLVAQRIFNLLPPRMPSATKLELAGNIWRHFGPSSMHCFAVGPAADAKSVIDTVSGRLNAVIQTYQIPQHVRNRFEWLSAGDVKVKDELLNYFRKTEQDLVISKLHEELPLLQKQMQDYTAQTISVRTKLEIHRNSVEIWIDHRLVDKYPEGLPDKSPVVLTSASTAPSVKWLIITAIIVVAAFLILTAKH